MPKARKPRPDNQKKKKKPFRFEWTGQGINRVYRYFCPEHEVWINNLTHEQINGNVPIVCSEGHEFTADLRSVEKLIALLKRRGQ